jgi:hypothetical protein
MYFSLFNASILPKKQCFLENSQAALVSNSGGRNKLMKTSRKHLWDDNDSGEI